MTDFEKTLCAATGDYCLKKVLDNGLTLYIAPNKRTVSYAVFSTNFGSVNSNFVCSDGTSFSLPDGMAHFLEHKMFETMDGGDAFELFAQTGADANAYTSFTKTSYLFACTQDFEQNLEILLDFVTHPHFTNESVDKEKGIITEEITMYDDHPAWQSRSEMMKGLYRADNPLIIDIAGDSASVSKATPELLYSIHSQFYDLSNMSVCIAGNVDIEKVTKLCEALKPSTRKEIPKTVFPKEEKASVEKYREKYMQVSRPVFSFGVKDTVCNDMAEMHKRAYALSIIATALFSTSSEFYTRLYDEGIVNNTFSSGYEYTEYYAMYMFHGESDKVLLLYDELCKYIEQVKENGLDKDSFEIARRAVYANILRGFESSARTCEEMSETGEFVFRAPDVISKITYDYAMDVFKSVFTPESYTLSVIKPLEQKGK